MHLFKWISCKLLLKVALSVRVVEFILRKYLQNTADFYMHLIIDAI